MQANQTLAVRSAPMLGLLDIMAVTRLITVKELARSFLNQMLTPVLAACTIKLSQQPQLTNQFLSRVCKFLLIGVARGQQGQNWQSTNEPKAGRPYSICTFRSFCLTKNFYLSRQNTPKFNILRSKTKKFSGEWALPPPQTPKWGGEHPYPRPTPPAPQIDPRKKFDKSCPALCPPPPNSWPRLCFFC